MMSIPDDFIPVENSFENIDLEKFRQNISNYQPKIELPITPSVDIPPNPIHETNRLLVEQNDKINELTGKLENADFKISKQTKELQSINCENTKLNVKIEVLNKTIDSQSDELKCLRNINAELKIANKSLKVNNQSNRHYWRNTILISLGVGVFSFVLGLFSTEAKTILQEILKILQ